MRYPGDMSDDGAQREWQQHGAVIRLATRQSPAPIRNHPLVSAGSAAECHQPGGRLVCLMANEILSFIHSVTVNLRREK